MSQQINLYQPIFRRQQKVFSAATLAQAAIVMLFGLAILYGVGRWQVTELTKDVTALEAQQAQAKAQLDALSAEVAAQRDDAKLAADIERTERDVQARQHLVKWLGEHGTTRSGGFSAHLTGLARQHRNDLWLQGISLANGGATVSLQGGSQNPAAVVRYLRRLGKEPAFAGLEFRSVRIDRDEDSPEYLRFHVSNAQSTPP